MEGLRGEAREIGAEKTRNTISGRDVKMVKMLFCLWWATSLCYRLVLSDLFPRSPSDQQQKW